MSETIITDEERVQSLIKYFSEMQRRSDEIHKATTTRDPHDPNKNGGYSKRRKLLSRRKTSRRNKKYQSRRKLSKQKLKKNQRVGENVNWFSHSVNEWI